MWVLAIETSSSIGSVAALAPDGSVTTMKVEVAGRHGDVVVPTVRDTLERAGIGMRDVGLLAAGIGPGSFTGVRAALGVVKGLSIATSLPISGIGSLEAMAAPVLREDPGVTVLALVDARRKEVFATLIAPDGTLIVPETSGTPGAIGDAILGSLDERTRIVVAANTDDASLIGPIVAALGAHDTRIAPAGPPLAADVARLAAARFARGERDDVASLVPRYVRPADAKPPAPPRWSTGRTS